VEVSDTESENSEKSKESVKSAAKDDLLAALITATEKSETSSTSSKSSPTRGRGRARLSDEEKAAKKAAKKATKKATKKAAKKATEEKEKSSEHSVTFIDEIQISEKLGSSGAAASHQMVDTPYGGVAESKDSDEKQQLEIDESDDEIECETFVLDDVNYLKSGNQLYDIDTHEPIGLFDPKTNKIIPNVVSDGELSEEELSDDE
jgi:hypothetical protein